MFMMLSQKSMHCIPEENFLPSIVMDQISVLFLLCEWGLEVWGRLVVASITVPVPFGGADTEFLNMAMKTVPFIEKPGAGCAER